MAQEGLGKLLSLIMCAGPSRSEAEEEQSAVSEIEMKRWMREEDGRGGSALLTTI